MQTFDNVSDFIASMNAERRAGTWYGGHFIVSGKDVSIKGFGTWNQILTVNGTRCHSCPDQSVRNWKVEIERAIQAN